MSRVGRRALSDSLRRALFVGASVTASGCIGWSSCPDDGVEPPLTELVPIAATDPDPDANACSSLCLNVGVKVVTCVRASSERVLCIGEPFPCEGRRPHGWVPVRCREARPFERHLSDAAHLEAASIDAFALLRRELREHGAPRRLLRGAGRARRDECRHARISAALARRFRANVEPVVVEAKPKRSVEEIALENAVEGCVRETWGALVVLHQAEHATEPLIRAAARRIARDEVFHASFSWMLDEWCRQRLSPPARRRVHRARNDAVSALERELASEMPEADRKRLGLPARGVAAAMLRELDESLWQRSKTARGVLSSPSR